jgi:hypothetical protein
LAKLEILGSIPSLRRLAPNHAAMPTKITFTLPGD